MNDEAGGRIFFSNTGRTFGEEDELCVLSVGVDIGSSTSHLVFSRIVLERLDTRYVVTERESFYQSDILLTPYAAEDEIDADALGAFIAQQYKDAKIDRRRDRYRRADPHRRRGAPEECARHRRIVRQAGRPDGRGLRRRQSRIGDGGLWLGRGGALDPQRAPVMNVDVGGGTAKIAVCADGKVIDVTALDVGARLIVLDDDTPHRPPRRSRPPLWRRAWIEA